MVSWARALSVALREKDTESFSLLVWSPGLVRLTGLLTSQVNSVLAVYVPSVAVIMRFC